MFSKQVKRVETCFRTQCKAFVNSMTVDDTCCISFKLYVSDDSNLFLCRSLQTNKSFQTFNFKKESKETKNACSYHIFIEIWNQHIDVCWFAYISPHKKLITPILDRSDNLSQFFQDEVVLQNNVNELLGTQVFIYDIPNADELSGNETEEEKN